MSRFASRSFALLVFAAAASMVAAPSCGTDDADPTYGGRDSAALDAAVRADRAQPRDVRVAFDATLDTSVLPPGPWEPLGSGPPCGINISLDPAASAPPFPWRACMSGRAGCLTFFAESPIREFWSFQPSRLAQPYEDSSGVHFSYTRQIAAPSGRVALAVVQTLHGAGEVAFAGRFGENSCAVLNVHSSPFGTAASIFEHPPIEGREEGPAFAHILHAPKGEMRRFTAVEVTSQLNRNPFIRGLAHGDGFVGIQGSHSPSALTIADGRVVSETPPVSGGELLPVPGGYLVKLDEGIGFVPIQGASRMLIRPLAGNEIVSFAVDVTAGNEIVWLESDAPISTSTVYASPFGLSERSISRRAVAKLPLATAGVVNEGVLAAPISASKLRIVRISDGLGWDVDGESDAQFMTNIWVNREFAWMGVSKASDGPPGVAFFAGMVRVPRPTEPPTIPSGL